MVENNITNCKLLAIAAEQSAVDMNCRADDFFCIENQIVYSAQNDKARKYLDLPFDCNLVTYGSNIVASVSLPAEAAVRDYVGRFPVEHCFETPNLHVLDDALSPLGLRVCFMAEYFLPDLQCLRELPCAYEIKVLTPDTFSDLYVPLWKNALCEKRRHLDVLAVAAYDAGRLVGLAGCSADCETMWQIGVDVLPEYRRRGIASALTGRLVVETLNRGKVPFYCAAWSNIPSVRNAVFGRHGQN